MTKPIAGESLPVDPATRLLTRAAPIGAATVRERVPTAHSTRPPWANRVSIPIGGPEAPPLYPPARLLTRAAPIGAATVRERVPTVYSTRPPRATTIGVPPS